MTGDPLEAIIEASSAIEALEKAVQWLKDNQTKMVKDEKVTITTLCIRGVWTAIIRYIST